ncbi:unnamed protein product [Prunus armeniaca]|uniref:Uncharacterized protein n=1 Tax=Prunus armeniaca TaxID=36596 RepID=A0A6J5Y9Y9_PRUAR|nr:unnamed protein product [Prunus armeniaca]
MTRPSAKSKDSIGGVRRALELGRAWLDVQQGDWALWSFGKASARLASRQGLCGRKQGDCRRFRQLTACPLSQQRTWHPLSFVARAASIFGTALAVRQGLLGNICEASCVLRQIGWAVRALGGECLGASPSSRT